MLVSSLDSAIRLLDKSNGGLLTTFKGHQNEDYRIPSVFGEKDQYIVSGSENGRIYMWDVMTGSVLREVRAHSDRVVSGVAFHPSKSQMTSCGVDGNIVFWT